MKTLQAHLSGRRHAIRGGAGTALFTIRYKDQPIPGNPDGEWRDYSPETTGIDAKTAMTTLDGLRGRTDLLKCRFSCVGHTPQKFTRDRLRAAITQLVEEAGMKDQIKPYKLNKTELVLVAPLVLKALDRKRALDRKPERSRAPLRAQTPPPPAAPNALVGHDRKGRLVIRMGGAW